MHTENGSFYIRFVRSIQAYRDGQLLYQVCKVYSFIQRTAAFISGL